MEVCAVGKAVFPGASAPCPALKLKQDGKSTFCQVVAAEAAIGSSLLALVLGIGRGCDSDYGDGLEKI